MMIAPGPEATTSHVLVADDSTGVPTLFVRGAWSDALARALAGADWRTLVLFHVDWPSYEPLAPFADRIERLRVPFGPDSSAGLEALDRLHTLQMTDVLVPPVDYRRLPRLRKLETIWHMRDAAHLSHPGLCDLFLHKVGGPDLHWIPEATALEVLELRGGSLPSLAGIERARGLRELRVRELRRCADVDAVRSLANLEFLELDAGKASMDDLDWLASMPRLRRVLIGCPARRIDWMALAAHPSLQSIAVTAPAGYSMSDAEILEALSAGGREPASLRRYPSKCPGFALEFAPAGRVNA